jgi:putative lipoic acid-binding regulatory protein
MPSTDTPFEFPCTYPIKAMGRAEPGFTSLVVETIRHHVPTLDADAVTTRASRGGAWLSVTVTIEATSKEQLDAIYRALTAHDEVVVAL